MVVIEELNSNEYNENDEGDDDHPLPSIQLGFSERVRDQDRGVIGHRSVRWWKDWDGGQVGGRPSWLQPRDLPSGSLRCSTCRSTMLFVCQLYAPLDHVPAAFHRSFYVFGCPTCCSSSNASPGKENAGGIRVLRVQLPKDNPFYPPAPQTPEEEATLQRTWEKHLPTAWNNAHVCAVCGQRATGKCPLQQEWFCGNDHQKEYKQHVHKRKQNDNSNGSIEQHQLQEQDDSSPCELSENDTATAMQFPSVFAESEIVIDEEPPPEATYDNDNNEDEDDEEDEEDRNHNVQKVDCDADLEQEDLNTMVVGTEKAQKLNLNDKSKEDPTTLAFYQRMQDRKVPEQCLRYTMSWRNQHDHKHPPNTDDQYNANKDKKETGNGNDNPLKIGGKSNDGGEDDEDVDTGQPLWIRSDHQPNDDNDIPPCPYCGARRQFEFQLMPQLLHFLLPPKPPKRKGTQEDLDPQKQAKQAVQIAQSIIELSHPTQIPPSFADAKERALAKWQQDILKDDRPRMEWGIVAVYTCTASCSCLDNSEGKKHDWDELGAYREEFAWVQPALELGM